MIESKTGDIVNEDTEALVNTVNCVGIMGRGIALQFKNVFPGNFEAYAEACKRKEVQPGRMFLYETGRLTNPRYIINFPTKRHWKGKSRLEDIESGLIALAEMIKSKKIHSIAIPPLGSGLGGLDWKVVRPLIVKGLEGLSHCKVILYEPGGAPTDLKANKSTEVPKMTAGRAAMVGLISRYLKGLLDPFITLLEVHKLLYFLQTAGEPLKLRYTKAPYGPYAENLRHLLKAVEGHLVSGYADGEDAPDKQLQLVPGALEDALSFLENGGQTKERLERVSDLVEGFETPFGLELLSTVHWIITHEQTHTLDEIVQKTYAWNEKKKQFSKRQIEVALKVLNTKGWLTGISSSN